MLPNESGYSSSVDMPTATLAREILTYRCDAQAYKFVYTLSGGSSQIAILLLDR